MAEIRALKTVIDKDTASVIEALEELIEKTNEGKIRSVAVAIVEADGSINTTWSDGSVAVMLGAATLLQARLARDAERG